jgi:predicted  nucleic acid-binding Zn-ribbon protein
MNGADSVKMICKGGGTMDLEHEKRLTETEQRTKSNTKRLDKVEKWQADFGDLISTVKVLADREARVEKDVGEIKEAVQEIKEKPSKRWDGLVEKIIFTVVGAVVAYVLVKIGF